MDHQLHAEMLLYTVNEFIGDGDMTHTQVLLVAALLNEAGATFRLRKAREMEQSPLLETIGEKCQICGKHYLAVWRAPDEIWEKLSGKGEGGLLCPPCFEKLAQVAGHTLYWSCQLDRYPGEE